MAVFFCYIGMNNLTTADNVMGACCAAHYVVEFLNCLRCWINMKRLLFHQEKSMHQQQQKINSTHDYAHKA